jgi:hypothetical protein
MLKSFILADFPAKNISYVNLSHLMDASAGDTNFTIRLITLISAEIPDVLIKMKNYIELQDLEKLSEISHRFRSSLTYIAADDTVNLLTEIENDAKENLTENVYMKYQAFSYRLTKIQSELSLKLEQLRV